MREFYNGPAFGESALSHMKLFSVQKKELSAAERNWKSGKPYLNNHHQDLFLDLWNRCWFLVLSGIIALSIPFLSFCSSWVLSTGRDNWFGYVCRVCIRYLCIGRIYPGISEIPKSVTNILKFRFHMYYKPATWKHLFSSLYYSYAFSNLHPLEKLLKSLALYTESTFWWQQQNRVVKLISGNSVSTKRCM